VFFNMTTQDTMTMLSSGLPFKARHEIHLDTFQFLILALSSPGSLVVDINTSASLFQLLLRLTLSDFNFFFCSFFSLSFCIVDLIKRFYLKQVTF